MVSCTMEERGLSVFENMILRQIFGLKRDENWEWRLHYEELHNLYRPPNIVRVIKSTRLIYAGCVTRMEEDRNAFKTLTGKSIGNVPLGRLRWKDNIRRYIKELGTNTRNC